MTEVTETQRLTEKVVEIKRVSKKTEGGNRFTFTALMVVGDRGGSVGVGLGKAPTVRAAIEKGITTAKKNMAKVPRSGGTIPFPVEVRCGAAHLLLWPASPGFGIVAGGSVRAIMEMAGIRDVSSKILGSRNKSANVRAALKAFQQLRELVEKYESF